MAIRYSEHEVTQQSFKKKKPGYCHFTDGSLAWVASADHYSVWSLHLLQTTRPLKFFLGPALLCGIYKLAQMLQISVSTVKFNLIGPRWGQHRWWGSPLPYMGHW